MEKGGGRGRGGDMGKGWGGEGGTAVVFPHTLGKHEASEIYGLHIMGGYVKILRVTLGSML